MFYIVSIVHSHSISLGMVLCLLFMIYAKCFININVLYCCHCTHCITKTRIAKIEIVYVLCCFHCTQPLDQHPGRGRHHDLTFASEQK